MEDATFAENMRKNILTSAFKAGNNGAHIAPSLSCVEILTALYNGILKYNKSDPFDEARDRLILSKGHAGLALYAALYEAGLISQKDYDSFEENGGDFPGQPLKNIVKRIEFSGGSLGMGLSYGIGLALAGRRVFVILGDGECNEGSICESAMFAGHRKIQDLTVIVDLNGMQADGKSADILTFDIKKMWEACGWIVEECNGHDVQALKIKLSQAHNQPKVILAHTVKGKGVSFMENAREWHHGKLTQAQLTQAISEITEGGYGN